MKFMPLRRCKRSTEDLSFFYDASQNFRHRERHAACIQTNDSFHGSGNIERTREKYRTRIQPKDKDRRNMFTTTSFILALNTLWIMCQAVPLLDLRNTLQQNVLDAMVSSACSSNGDCWEWLPVQEVEKNVPTISENLPMSKMHIRRQAESIDPNTVIETWGNNSPPLNRKAHQSSLAAKQIGNRMSKKDTVMSRSWGAGGMPFSVLYMNLHGSRGNHASTAQQQEGKTESSTPPIMHPNPRITLRNGSSIQTRRQYSIIPQLFISYGWGPFGK